MDKKRYSANDIANAVATHVQKAYHEAQAKKASGPAMEPEEEDDAPSADKSGRPNDGSDSSPAELKQQQKSRPQADSKRPEPKKAPPAGKKGRGPF